MTGNEFNSRAIKCRLSAMNQIVLPKRIVDEYEIKPRDTIGLIGKRARGVGVVAFNVSVHHHNNSVTIPKQVVTFCGFSPGDTIQLKMVRVIHTPAPPLVS